MISLQDHYKGRTMAEKQIERLVKKEIEDRIWAIYENEHVATYLIEGNKKSILIDTGWGIGGLAEMVNTISTLPLLVVCTHGHPDHTCGAFQFRDIHIAKEDKELLLSFYNKSTRKNILEKSQKPPYPAGFLPDKWIKAEMRKINTIEEGNYFDLGGRTLKVIAMPGHTAGSLCFLDEEAGLLFSGDSVMASPVLLHLDSSLPLSVYHTSLMHLSSYSSKFTKILPGHGDSPVDSYIVEELLNGVSDILKGKIKGKPAKTFLGDGLLCNFKRTGIVYKEDRL
jgi:hydroxyacylglutathione hydrolase